MRHYIYSLQSEKDLEKITDDIYEQDMLESATSVVLELFSAGKHKDVLQRLSDFLIEKYPELPVEAVFVTTSPVREDDDVDKTTLVMMILENSEVTDVGSKKFRSVSEAKQDPLSGVYTRTEIERVFVKLVEEAGVLNSALVLLDIDKLDQINVSLGHDAGDYVIRKTADIIKQILRDSDVIGRWESEKFMILLRDVDAESTTSVSERIREKIETEDFADVKDVTASFGATLITPGVSCEEIFEKADRALAMAKENGRNRFEML